MRAFGGCRLFDIDATDLRTFLARLDREDLSPHTVNIHRQVLHAIFEFARREETFALPDNPAAATSKRPEDGPSPVETFEPEEIRSIAEAARAGLHRRRSGYPQSVFSAETEREWRRINAQDASLFIVAATTGLRIGELGALRWCDVDLEGGFLTVSRAISAGQETSPKSRRSPYRPAKRSSACVGASTSSAARTTCSAVPMVAARPLRREDPLRPRSGGGGPAGEALPRSTPHLRQPGDQALRPGRGEGDDGPLQADDDRALPALAPPAQRRGEAHGDLL
jgi:hypothetical protein